MPKKLPELNLNTYDNLFADDEQRQIESGERIVTLPTNQLKEFRNHPFKVRMDEDMLKLCDSVKDNGVILPIMVRPLDDGGGYEIVAGHRRKTASEINNIEEIPCIIRKLTDDQATIIMVDSNIQREHILPSERGFAFKLKLDAMKHQGKRTDLSSAQLGQKLKNNYSVEQLAEETGETRSQIQRHIRLTYLIPELIEYVDGVREDAKKIAFNPAVELSYLTQEQQYSVLENIAEFESTPSLSQAQRMKELNKMNKLNEDVIFAVMTEEKPNQKEKISLKSDDINKYFPRSYTPRQKTEQIIQLLEEWSKKREKKEPVK